MCMSKINTKETKPKQSLANKSVEKIEYEPVGPLILFIGAYSKKIRIWKMEKNPSPRIKCDPLTTNIFWIYNF